MSAAAQLPLGLELEPSFAAADFVAAECNRAAHAWIMRWPDWPAPGLVLHGPPGAGKSHLGRIWAARAGAVRPGDAGASTWAGAWLLDPVLPVQDEVGLLHHYNRLREQRGQLLLIARTPPAQWPLRLPDLASRLRALPAVAIGLPDDALLRALLVKLFSDRQLRVPEPVITFLLARIERSFEAARSVVARLDALALGRGRPVTLDLARSVLDPASGAQPAQRAR